MEGTMRRPNELTVIANADRVSARIIESIWPPQGSTTVVDVVQSECERLGYSDIERRQIVALLK